MHGNEVLDENENMQHQHGLPVFRSFIFRQNFDQWQAVQDGFENLPPLAPSWIVSCTTPRPSPLPGKVIGIKTAPPFPEKRRKTRRSNPSPTNLRPQNRRAEWLAFRFCSFYFAAYDYGKRSIFASNRPCWPQDVSANGVASKRL
jgi:hypothetical protein